MSEQISAEIAAAAKELVATWPPLTPEQIAHVANVLRNGATGGIDR